MYCEELSVLQNIIIRHYRASTDEATKDFLIGLLSASLSKNEVNMHVLPHIMPPGKVRNMALISDHQWTDVRAALGNVPTPTKRGCYGSAAKGEKKSEITNYQRE